ncbi:MAG: amidohydrolase [Calditrichaeota bacterium]|nr:amidohydrolase [Calditrichota bacterium]RQW04435.1 MAG: amidohydrolase [Calditrichota bacterium]
MKNTLIDLIVHNALIYDPIEGHLSENALAVSKNRVFMLGKDSTVLLLKQPGTRVINAGGRLLLPAFMDCHTHFIGYVRRQQEVRLEDCRSLSETLKRIRKKVEQTPEGEWITGGGWNQNIWEKGDYPHRKHLDEISTRHYIALDSKDWHTCWVNSPVLKMAGYSVDKPYDGAGHLAIDPVTGDFTGVLEENNRLIVYDLMPDWTYERIRYHFLQATADFYRYGFSSIHTVESGNEFRIFQQARRLEELGLRTFWYMPVKLVDDALNISLEQDLGDDCLKVSGVKIFVDGSFGSQTAELFENYDNSNHSGVESMTESELNLCVQKAVQARLSCAIHAIGDRAVSKTLHVLEKFSPQSINLGLRHRIEHVQLIQSDDLPLFRAYQIYASVQPIHLADDIPVIRKHLSSRAHLTYPFGSLKRKGARLIFGSDTPIEDFNPWKAIYSAMERKYQLQEKEETFFPGECLDLETCLKAHTMRAAESVGMGKKLGRIQPGWLADFFLASMNPFKIQSTEIKNIESVFTVANGKIVYDKIT